MMRISRNNDSCYACHEYTMLLVTLKEILFVLLKNYMTRNRLINNKNRHIINNEDLIHHLFCTLLFLQLNRFCFFPIERLCFVLNSEGTDEAECRGAHLKTLAKKEILFIKLEA